MSYPSQLYRNLSLPAGVPLLDTDVGDHALADRLYSVDLHRGSGDITGYEPGTITLETPDNVSLSGGAALDVALSEDACDHIATRVGLDPELIVWRFRGRIGTQVAHDKANPQRWQGSTVTGAAWPSVLAYAPETYTPTSDALLSHAAGILFQPSWEPRLVLDLAGPFDRWPPAGPHDPVTAADLLSLLDDRLYAVTDTRDGRIKINALESLELRAEQAAAGRWPLARAHVLAPTTWEQPSEYAVEYLLHLRTPTGYTDVRTGPEEGTRTIELDWTDTVAHTEQWRRVYGLRWQSRQGAWRLPELTVRLDYLISSRYEAHRRAAGSLLRMEVGDPLPLAGDWPPPIDGVHFCTAVDERITHRGWEMTLSLTPYSALAGQTQLPVPPRTWSQAGERTWQDAGTNTWDEGITV